MDAGREQVVHYFRALFTVAQIITSSLDVEEVLNRLTQTTARVLGVKGCVLRLLDEKGETLVLRAAYGLSARYLHKGPVERGASPIDQAALQGDTVVIADVASDPRFQYPAEARAEGIASVLCVPLRAHGQVIGVMRVYTSKPRAFAPIEQEFLQALADLGALALVNARIFESVQQDYHDAIDTLWGTPAGQ